MIAYPPQLVDYTVYAVDQRLARRFSCKEHELLLHWFRSNPVIHDIFVYGTNFKNMSNDSGSFMKHRA